MTITATPRQGHARQPRAVRHRPHYEAKTLRLSSLALSNADSRDVFARWAEAYDRDTR